MTRRPFRLRRGGRRTGGRHRRLTGIDERLAELRRLHEAILARSWAFEYALAHPWNPAKEEEEE